MLRSFTAIKSQLSRFTTAASTAAPETYNKGMAIFHWTMAIGVGSCIGSVLYAQSLDRKDPKRGEVMRFHKSMGLAMATLIVPRIGYRLISKIPAHIPGSKLQTTAADAAHYALYGSVLTLAGSGIVMGYYSGFGVPFFTVDKMIPGAKEKNTAISGNAFWVHSNVGKFLEYLVPIHVGAVGLHMAQGHRILV